MQDFHLAASLASRICHDLVSPVGAIVNGVDLVRETNGAEWSEAAGMIGQSAGRASALLQFYRIAFGAAEPDSPGLSRSTLAGHLDVLASPPRVTLEWDERHGAPLARVEARLVSLLLLCARSVTGMRGVIRLRTGIEAIFPLSLSVEGESFSRMLGMLDMLDGAAPCRPVSPREVEFVLARDAACGMGVRLGTGQGDGRVTIEAVRA